MHRERFAPSPTGNLHLGHAYSALTAWKSACNATGELVVRIEDIDASRSRREYEIAILEDLEWLGIRWKPPVVRQSQRMAVYQAALRKLETKGLCYPCGCTRRDIQNALSAPQAEVRGRERRDSCVALPYPGTCRGRAMTSKTKQDAVRLNMRRAIDLIERGAGIQNLSIEELGAKHRGRHRLDAEWLLGRAGDIVLARRDIGTSYHLAVVVDDAAQVITHVTRGEDLFEFTQIHRLLQALLGLQVPIWRHHPLVRDEAGARLAKRDDARSLRAYRSMGMTAEDIVSMLENHFQ